MTVPDPNAPVTRRELLELEVRLGSLILALTDRVKYLEDFIHEACEAESGGMGVYSNGEGVDGNGPLNTASYVLSDAPLTAEQEGIAARIMRHLGAETVKAVPDEPSDDVLQTELDPNLSADANLQHLQHLFEGYRACIRGGEKECPYSPGSARQFSWSSGWRRAHEDTAL